MGFVPREGTRDTAGRCGDCKGGGGPLRVAFAADASFRVTGALRIDDGVAARLMYRADVDAVPTEAPELSVDSGEGGAGGVARPPDDPVTTESGVGPSL